MSLLEPELMADVRVLFPADRSKTPQLFVFKPDTLTPDWLAYVVQGVVGSVIQFAKENGLNTFGMVGEPRCLHCGASGQVPAVAWPCGHPQ